MTTPKTHPSIALPSPNSPPTLLQSPTHAPNPNEALIKVAWTCSTPLDLHRTDGNLAISSFPFFLGTAFAGTVISLWLRPPTLHSISKEQLHETVKEGDKVFGFVSDGNEREAGFQEYVTVPVHRISKLPANVPYGLKEAVTVPANLVTAFHTLTTDLGVRLPWPKPKSFRGGDRNKVLIWGGASSVGIYTIQALRHWGYTNVIAVASGKHHEELKRLGARVCFDYRNPGVVGEILDHLDKENKEKGPGPRIPYFVDCIGSRDGTLKPLSQLAERGSRVAVMLPVIIVHAAEGRRPVFAADEKNVEGMVWQEGVEVKGVRTLNYEENSFYRDKLQPEIIPALLAQGVIEPNKTRVVEGATLLERAQKALQLLRDQAPSGERLVWRVSEDEQ